MAPASRSACSAAADLIRTIKTRGPDVRVGDAMVAEMPTISHRATLEQAFKLLQQKSAQAVGVTDASGKLVGFVTSETIAEMMMLQEALPKRRALRPLEPAGRCLNASYPMLSSICHAAVEDLSAGMSKLPA